MNFEISNLSFAAQTAFAIGQIQQRPLTREISRWHAFEIDGLGVHFFVPLVVRVRAQKAVQVGLSVSGERQPCVASAGGWSRVPVLVLLPYLKDSISNLYLIFQPNEQTL